MKKKIISLAMALACASTCAAALVACGGGESKAHSVENWRNIFDVELNSQNYVLSEYDINESTGDSKLVGKFLCDSVEQIYFDISYGDSYNFESYLFKKDSGYYTGTRHYSTASFESTADPVKMSRITATEFADKLKYTSVEIYETITQEILKNVRDSYNSFRQSGSGDGEKGKTICYSNDSGTSITVSQPGENGNVEVVYNVETVDVNLFEVGGLSSINVRGITYEGGKGKMDFSYSTDIDELKKEVMSVTVPYVVGPIFALSSIDVDGDVPYEELENYRTWGESVVEANENHTIKQQKNANTLSGDIVLDDIRLAEFSLTDDEGDITITNGSYTLTGYCWINDDYQIELVLTTTIKADDETTDVEFTYIFTAEDPS